MDITIAAITNVINVICHAIFWCLVHRLPLIISEHWVWVFIHASFMNETGIHTAISKKHGASWNSIDFKRLSLLVNAIFAYFYIKFASAILSFVFVFKLEKLKNFSVCIYFPNNCVRDSSFLCFYFKGLKLIFCCSALFVYLYMSPWSTIFFGVTANIIVHSYCRIDLRFLIFIFFLWRGTYLSLCSFTNKRLLLVFCFEFVWWNPST